MPLQIREVKTIKELKAFLKFTRKHYKNHPYWTPTLSFEEEETLRWDKNPAFAHCEARYWLAYQGDEIVGRVAAILNHKHIEKWDQRYLRFGWIEFIDDPEVSKALIETVESWARENDLIAIHGPLGFTDLDPEGLLVDGFEELSTLATIYNYPYYPEHLEKLGFQKDIDWVEYEITVPEKPNEKIAKAAKIVLERNNLKLLKARNKRHLLTYADELFELLDEEYSHLYGTVPLTRAQMKAYINQYLGFVTPQYVPVVLDENDHMVAFGIVMPSLSHALQKSGGYLFPFGFVHYLKALLKNNRADLYLIAVKSEYQGKGVNAVLIDQISQIFIKKGIKKVETNPELENNINVQGQWKFFNTRQHKRRRCYIKHLEVN
jgi:GNAT superfamily N-acetyltransferase